MHNMKVFFGNGAGGVLTVAVGISEADDTCNSHGFVKKRSIDIEHEKASEDFLILPI